MANMLFTVFNLFFVLTLTIPTPILEIFTHENIKYVLFIIYVSKFFNKF